MGRYLRAIKAEKSANPANDEPTEPTKGGSVGSVGASPGGSAGPRPAEDTDDGDRRLSELLAGQPVVRVRSQVLGETVVWAADDARIPLETEEVVYRESELRRLVGHDPAMIRAIHRAKQGLDGEVEG